MTIAKTYYLYPVHYGVETRFRVVEMNNNIVTREWIFDYSQDAKKKLQDLQDSEDHKDYKMMQKSITELNYDGNESRGRYGEDESV
jgi:hypothetical protein